MITVCFYIQNVYLANIKKITKGNAMLRNFIFVLCLIVNGNVLAKEVVVEIYKKKFTPAHITIEVGDTVVWKNIEKRQYHNVWFKKLQKEEPDYFFPGESYQQSFSEVGAFAYECGPHPKMKGSVTVVE